MILWPIALDENGQEIRIKDAPAHGKFRCICCGQQMKARKGKDRVPHFAHVAENPSCVYESYLHYTLKNLLYDRIIKRDGIAVIHNGKRIELSKYSVCELEKYVGPIKPDIYVVVDGVEYFLEICFTNPCSEEKIDFGKRIIEIKTKDYDSHIELATGDISEGAKHYSLVFYNFPSEPRIRKTAVAQRFPFEEPFMTHDGSDNEFELHGDIPWQDTSIDTRRQIKNDVPIAQASVSGGLNHAIPSICHYILYSDGKDKVVRVDIDRVMIRVAPEATLELGVSIADNQFSYEVGRRYAADKGLISRELLTDIEHSLDMVAIRNSFGYQEIENKR